MDEREDFAELSYGTLLGEYFHVVSTIVAMEAELDDETLEQSRIYRELCEARADLCEQLDETARPHVDADLRSAFEEAFSDRRDR